MKLSGVQFRSGIKVYDFDQGDLAISPGDFVLVETIYGEEIGKVIYIDKEAGKEDGSVKGIKKLLDEDDIDRLVSLRKRHDDFLEIFRKKVLDHKLEMKAVDFEFSLDGEKVTFYFTAEGRVDFRELVRDLSRNLKVTVILRQMGQRDEARLLMGFGPCGRAICCQKFLTHLENISMDMVREQYEGSRNASKVSGMCGRLMCCLSFEDNQKIDRKTKGDEK